MERCPAELCQLFVQSYPDFLRPIDPHVKIALTMANAMGGPQQFDFVHVRRGDKVNPTMWPHLDRDTRPKAGRHGVLCASHTHATPLSVTTYLLCAPSPSLCHSSPMPPPPLPHANPSPPPCHPLPSPMPPPPLPHATTPSLLQKLPQRIPPGSTLYIATNERDTHFFDPLLAVYKLYKEDYFAELWAEGSVWEREMRVVAAGVGVEGRVEADSEVLVLVDYQLKYLARNALETFNDLTDDPRDGESCGAVGI
ncbi:unnamed protein product [Closterium sp. NIES-53]